MSTAKTKRTAPPAPTPAPAAEAAPPQAEQAADTAPVEAVAALAPDVAGTGDATVFALPQDQVQAQAARSYEDAIRAAKENMDALTRSGTILSHGLQDLGKTVFALTQESVEETVAASKRMMAARTLRELFDLQAGTVKAGFDKLMSETARLSDLSVKLAEEAFAPINDRVHATVDTMVKTAARSA